MKYKSVYLNKILLTDLLKMILARNIDIHNYYVVYLDRERDQRVFKRIWGETFKAMINHIRQFCNIKTMKKDIKTIG